MPGKEREIEEERPLNLSSARGSPLFSALKSPIMWFSGNGKLNVRYLSRQSAASLDFTASFRLRSRPLIPETSLKGAPKGDDVDVMAR